MNPVFAWRAGLAIVLAGLGVAGVFSYRHMAAKAATADTRIEAAEQAVVAANAATKLLQSRLDTLSAEAIRRTEFDAHVRSERAKVARNLDTASREDPTAAGYLSQPIPQRVRDAYAAPDAAPAATER